MQRSWVKQKEEKRKVWMFYLLLLALSFQLQKQCSRRVPVFGSKIYNRCSLYMQVRKQHLHRILREVAQLERSVASPTTLTTPKEVAEKPTYIPVTLRTLTEALGADLGHTTSPRKQVKRAMSVAPYYREGLAGQRVKIPLKCFKTKQVIIATTKEAKPQHQEG